MSLLSPLNTIFRLFMDQMCFLPNGFSCCLCLYSPPSLWFLCPHVLVFITIIHLPSLVNLTLLSLFIFYFQINLQWNLFLKTAILSMFAPITLVFVKLINLKISHYFCNSSWPKYSKFHWFNFQIFGSIINFSLKLYNA